MLVVDDRSSDHTSTTSPGRTAPEVFVQGTRRGRSRGTSKELPYATRDLEWGAMGVTDADSVINPAFFDECERCGFRCCRTSGAARPPQVDA